MPTCSCTANVTGLPSVFVRRDTVRFQLCFTDDLGSAVNISGWEIWFTLRDEMDTPRERVTNLDASVSSRLGESTLITGPKTPGTVGSALQDMAARISGAL